MHDHQYHSPQAMNDQHHDTPGPMDEDDLISAVKPYGNGSVTLLSATGMSISSPYEVERTDCSPSQGDTTRIGSERSNLYLPSPYSEKRLPTITIMEQPAPSSPLSSLPPSQNYSRPDEPDSSETPLPVLPLLHYISHSITLTGKKRLLKLLLLSGERRAQLLSAEPDLYDLLQWPHPSIPDDRYIEARITHMDYTSLRIMLTAYKQTEERLNAKEQVNLGIEIGKLGLEMLNCMQLEAEREASIERRRKTEMDTEEKPDTGRNRSKAKKVVRGDISKAQMIGSPGLANPTTPVRNGQKTSVPLSRRTSSMRHELMDKRYENDPVKGASLEPTGKSHVDVKQIEASDLIKEIGWVILTSVSIWIPF
jgi:hypothetical protein